MIKRLLYSVVALLWVSMVMAETGSPSSRFGYGELNVNMPNELRAMGGVTAAMRSNHTINPSQPASYTAGDSLSFMFDIGMSVGWCNYQDSYGKKNSALGSLEYITLQCPLWKRWIAFSCGVIPFSHVGYDFTMDGYALNMDETTSSYVYHKNYQGKGGLSQVYGGLSFNILDWFAAGANFYYNFGNVFNYTILSFDDATAVGTQKIQYMDMSAFTTKVGAQLFHRFGKHYISLGATYDPKLKLGGQYLETEANRLDTIIRNTGCEMPQAWTVGMNYTWNQRLSIAVDYSRQDWQDAIYFGKKGYLHNHQRVSVGAQYQHNMFGLNYYDRMFWRLGASIKNNYAAGDNWQNWDDFTVSIGVGFPLRTSATVINTTIEYGRNKLIIENNSLMENNLRLIIDVAVNETWFHKRKL